MRPLNFLDSQTIITTNGHGTVVNWPDVMDNISYVISIFVRRRCRQAVTHSSRKGAERERIENVPIFRTTRANNPNTRTKKRKTSNKMLVLSHRHHDAVRAPECHTCMTVSFFSGGEELVVSSLYTGYVGSTACSIPYIKW